MYRIVCGLLRVLDSGEALVAPGGGARGLDLNAERGVAGSTRVR
jgi:hypothetical protein